MTDRELMEIADQQIDWIKDKLDISREAGRLALLSVLMSVRDQLPSTPVIITPTPLEARCMKPTSIYTSNGLHIWYCQLPFGHGSPHGQQP